jgi:hypothetical protein
VRFREPRYNLKESLVEKSKLAQYAYEEDDTIGWTEVRILNALLPNVYMYRREQKSWSWISRRPEARNDCAGDSQQQFDRPTRLPSDRG